MEGISQQKNGGNNAKGESEPIAPQRRARVPSVQPDHGEQSGKARGASQKRYASARPKALGPSEQGDHVAKKNRKRNAEGNEPGEFRRNSVKQRGVPARKDQGP